MSLVISRLIRAKTMTEPKEIFKINRQDKAPLYDLIEQNLRELILGGRLNTGEAVPSEWELADLYGVSRLTVRNALDNLKTMDISFPVWDRSHGSGGHAAYQVSGFARVRVLNHQLPRHNRLTVRFLGFTSCDQQNLVPTVDAGADQVITLPAAATLAGTVNDDGLPTSGKL